MKNSFLRHLACVQFVLLLCLPYQLQAVYILRYSTTTNGGISYTGNTLGLSKKASATSNQAGTSDAIGAFITTQQPLPHPVGSGSTQYPNYGTAAGTTLLYQDNSSTGVLDIPAGSTVLYAELIWSGSYDFSNENLLANKAYNGPVKITVPGGTTYQVKADPASSQLAVTPSYATSNCPNPPTPCTCPCGNYVSSNYQTTASQSLASIIQSVLNNASIHPPYVFTVGAVAGTVNYNDDTHNAAGWALAVIYSNPNMYTYNMTLFTGCEQASYTDNSPAPVTGFCVPPSGAINGRIFVSATEGDANKTGDHLLFSSTTPPPISAKLSGVNNPANNFFCSQINTLLPQTIDANGKLVAVGSSQLDTRGSYGTYNPDPVTATDIVGGRQGFDITSIDVSSLLKHNQTTAYALGITDSGGDDYTLSSIAMQIQVGAPIIVATKVVSVNGGSPADSVNALVGDDVTFSFTLTNSGTADASSVVFTDLLETGGTSGPGLTYVPGTFMLNGVKQPDPAALTPVEFSLPNPLAVGDSATIQFEANIGSYPPTENVFYDSASVTYEFRYCSTGTDMPGSAVTNQVEIILPCLCACCPGVPQISCISLKDLEEYFDSLD